MLEEFATSGLNVVDYSSDHSITIWDISQVFFHNQT